MLNKKTIESFKQFEKLIDDYEFFQFYEFDDFINYYDYDKYKSHIDEFKNKYNCNNENTIVLLCNYYECEYLTINFENDTLIVSRNVVIENVNDEITQNALYDILYMLIYY